ncbi:hypothetical protein GCM10009122_35770 [Fulvivirga kasyanovii]|uniref:Tetratricopeptide repeat protein n=1 Tax=Fulvivirga kasyanovii TaxID=396812 RepID=A0ABW9RJQ6_9BACT|nr:hypothetical protein [Fulvivirga kasyanovii]MTI24314.1 hypothetical protein [Fulvivirga kasyanovii]
MSKEKSDALFNLIKSLKKSEKRYFRLFVSAEEGHSDKKYIRLFDLIDSQNVFDEEALLKKDSSINPKQLSNLKAHLYKKILQSIRQYNQSTVLDIQIREMIDHAQILFNRSLYDQCATVLKKAKKHAHKIDNLELQLEILKWEKNVLTQTVGPGNQIRVNRIIEEVQDTNNRINNINSFTNLSVKLNSLYYKIGFIRNKSDYEKIVNMFNISMPNFNEEELSLNEKLNLYSLFVNYYFFIQDFENGYKFAKKWVALFDKHKEIRISKVDMYLRAINNLMIAQYKVYKYYEFVETSRQLRQIRHFPKNVINENIRLKLLKYTYVHEFNRFFMLGDFDLGVSLLTKIKPGLEQFITQLDNHSTMIMYYKIACLYFGNSNYSDAISWLNRIINSDKVDIREDIHSFARILNLISHYELGNVDVIDYYIRSTYRFLLKKDDMHDFQKYILKFLKKLSFSFTEDKLIPEFKKLRKQLLPLQNNPYEKRAFIYFDIIAWLECKIQKRPVADVISEKAQVILRKQRKAA